MSALFTLDGVSHHYRRSAPAALQDVTFSVEQGRSLGLVGESGSGKTTALSLLLGLRRPSAGTVLFEGAAPASGTRGAVQAFRRAVQPVYQDPFASLDPRQRVDSVLAEPLRWLGDPDARGDRSGALERRDRLVEALRDVELDEDALLRYPHEFSGGQRQRIAIARALITRPRALLADEPVSALDLSTRLDIVRLLARLQAEHGMTLVMVSHDLSIVAELCADVVVLQGGRVVDAGRTSEVLADPRSAYTRSLIDAVPRLPQS
ncbi:MAG: ATP-binding cassette domain-containing protein [Microbacterium sp.]|jgi:peptide/nickel transport system ATP-binding protein|uniref:ABC transporter ATP-binding protein n=1 Tax=Microbacterium sp. TaxID=51671 RepID=UPI002830F581|nr:ATP-binding cassette domain-containing protein [Microbacterium sp.]MDR2322738.1 ATP-binding cassette domain-containing protein [Microbacterium sp.]